MTKAGTMVMAAALILAAVLISRRKPVAVQAPAGGKGRKMPKMRPDFWPLFDSIGATYGVPPNLLRAIAWQESRFNPAAVGENKNKAGKVTSRDLGLMQINGRNLKNMGISEADAMRPEVSIRAAAMLLKSMKRELGSRFSARNWAAAYNVGSNLEPADKAEAYSKSVLAYWKAFDEGRA